MKRTTALIFAAVMLCLALAGCDPVSYYFDRDELTERVVGVELINYDNPDRISFGSWVPDHSSELADFDSSRVSVLASLEEEEIPGFIDALCEAEILEQYYAYDSPADVCIRLNYSDGGFLILCCDYAQESYSGYIGEFTADGEVAEYIGNFSSYTSFVYLADRLTD